MNTNFSLIFKKILPYMIIAFVAYLISSLLYFYLPKNGVEYIKDELYNLKYKNYGGFYSNVQIVQKPIVHKKVNIQQIQKISKYLLRGIFFENQNIGWAIIEEKTGLKKSYILAQNDKIDGYTLSRFYEQYVIFTRNSKEYKLELKAPKKTKFTIASSVVEKVSNKEIRNNNGLVQIKRNYLNSYVKNVDKIWNNIAINELMNGGKIDGFRVDRINKNSAFGKLGLQQGDVIKAINNNVLKSYADAFRVYNKINDTKYLSIEILRNNELMELNYEID